MNSETSSCRESLKKWVVGNGLDIGAGGDPIIPTAICIDRAETQHRAHVGNHPTHLVWDAFGRLPFEDGTLDYVFSSHCLEDAKATTSVLIEWMRVLKPGGHLVLFLPDQKLYEAECAKNGSIPNQDHVWPNFSMQYVLDCLNESGVKFKVVHQQDAPTPTNPYSFELAVCKL
jgi:predicted SAM-dependent methyltransferase